LVAAPAAPTKSNGNRNGNRNGGSVGRDCRRRLRHRDAAAVLKSSGAAIQRWCNPVSGRHPAAGGGMLSRFRALIMEAVPDAIEEWKWATPVWSYHGLICTGETYKKIVKLTFAKGASLADPSGLFNSSLEGKVRRAIDVHEGDDIDEKAFKVLIRAAVALNTSAGS
jgi:hypothetical protein